MILCIKINSLFCLRTIKNHYGVFGWTGLSFNPTRSDVWMSITSIKFSLIIKLITQKRTKLDDESFKLISS
jgi:hypothetical protein